jgi:hypothetical protein
VLLAQNGVTVSGLAISAGTVTFNVSWDRDAMPVELWSDTVWVFVDYNNKGVMERLPLSPGATLTATSPGGKVIEEPDNNKGVWVAGNARSAGSFSATVQLLTTVNSVGGACVYASNYPPVGKYLSASEISFTGTPEYKVVLERNDESTYTVTVDKGKSLLIPNGEATLSFTDKTGAPGTFTCIPMTGSIDFTVPAIVSKGLAASLEAVTSNLTAPDAAALTYTWSAPEFSPDTHIGATYTPIAPANPGTYPVTLTVSSEGYCDLMASKDVEVIDCMPPTVYDLEVSASGFCEGDAGVTFALSWTDAENSYQLYRDGAAVGMPLEGKGSPATFSGFFEAGTYTAWTVPGGAFCPAEMNGSFTIVSNPLPDAPVMGGGGTYCNAGTITATAGSGGNGIRWTDEDNTASSRIVTASGTYFAVSTTEAGCESISVGVTATVTLRGSSGRPATCGCEDGTVNCSGTCRTLRTYTVASDCSSTCALRYYNTLNQCGEIVAYNAGVTPDDSCWWSGCPPVFDIFCRSDPETHEGYGNNQSCWPYAQGYRYYSFSHPDDNSTVCYRCTKY